jgi:hypothetical protein
MGAQKILRLVALLCSEKLMVLFFSEFREVFLSVYSVEDVLGGNISTVKSADVKSADVMSKFNDRSFRN